MATVHKRDDVNASEGENKYGDVPFADETNKKYPIDSAEHVRAAWSYINHPENAAKYDNRDDVQLIKGRIRRAAEKFGVEISDD